MATARNRRLRPALSLIIAGALTAGPSLAQPPAATPPADPAAAAPAPAPDAQEPVPTVDAIVSHGLAPVPQVGRGAPALTADEIETKRKFGREENNYYQREMDTLISCYVRPTDEGGYGVPPNAERLEGYERAIEASRDLGSYANSAQRRTNEALLVRQLAAQGNATQAQLETAELARQEAVIRMMLAEEELEEARAVAIDIQELAINKVPLPDWRGTINANAAMRARTHESIYNMVPPQYRDLKLENLQVVERLDAAGNPSVYVSGAIRNTRTRRIDVPPISVTAVDELGYALKSETASAHGRIEPGAAFAFGYELKPSPNLAASVIVTFADPNTPAWLLPASADPVCAGDNSKELDPRFSGSNRPPTFNPRQWGIGARRR